jgi:hypothetical protein
VPEQSVSHPHQRKHARQVLRGISRGKIDTLVAEHALDNASPSKKVEVRPPILRTDEFIPLARPASERFNAHCYAIAAQRHLRAV